MKEVSTGVWMIQDTVTEHLGTDQEIGYSVDRMAIHLAGQPHLRAATGAIATLFDHRGVPLTRRGQCTILRRVETGSVYVHEGNLITYQDRPFLMTKRSRTKGHYVDGWDVLDARDGYGKQGSLELVWQEQAAKLGRIGKGSDVSDIPVFDVDSEEEHPLIHAVYAYEHPGFGGGRVPGCLFFATDVQPPEDDMQGIVNGYLWAPPGSELTSEHGSVYFEQLEQQGARLLDFNPGMLTFRHCVLDRLPETFEAVLEQVLRPACAHCGAPIRVNRYDEPHLPYLHVETGNGYCLIDGVLPLFPGTEEEAAARTSATPASQVLA